MTANKPQLREYTPKGHGARVNIPKVDYTNLPPEIMAIINESKNVRSTMTADKDGVRKASASHSQQERMDIKDLFRKEIAKWKDEDPLFMAYVYGEEAGRKEEREKVLDDLKNLFKWTNKEGNFRPWDIGHITRILNEYRDSLRTKGDEGK